MPQTVRRRNRRVVSIRLPVSSLSLRLGIYAKKHQASEERLVLRIGEGQAHRPRYIKPLTFTYTSGALYKRSGETERQILETLNLSPEELIVHAENLNEETLAYLIREYSGSGEAVISRKLMAVLLPRCDRIIGSVLRSLSSTDAYEDARGAILAELAEGLVGPPSNDSDFLQVKFGLVLKRLSITALNKCSKYLNRLRASVDISTEPTEPSERGSAMLSAPGPSAEVALETRSEFEGALKAIRDDDHRKAFTLLCEGWQIESSDPEVPTISGSLGVTSRTIRSWLTEVEKDIQKYRRRIP